jgi:hypothetical protein
MKAIAVAALALSLGSTLHAQVLLSGSDPALSGSTMIDFSAFGNGFASSYGDGFASVVGVSGLMRSSLDYSGNYGMTGRYIDNSEGTTVSIRFDFASTVTAFGFIHGAMDRPFWQMDVYDGGGALVGTTPVLPNPGNGYADFMGWQHAAGISYATLRMTSESYDYVMIDDFEYVRGGGGSPTVTPEPVTMTLLGTGLAGVAAARRRRKQSV